MKPYCFGIDVGGTTVKCGFFQTDGTLVEKWEIPTRKEDHGVNVLPDIGKTILDKMAEKGITAADVEGAGVGIPGPVRENRIPYAVNLGWGAMDIAKELGELTGLKIKAGNDANVAALGEMWKGGAEGHSNVIVVTLGTGVGGGIIIDGRIVEGAHGAGGEIGHAHVEDDIHDPCGCGNFGCLEQDRRQGFHQDRRALCKVSRNDAQRLRLRRRPGGHRARRRRLEGGTGARRRR